MKGFVSAALWMAVAGRLPKLFCAVAYTLIAVAIATSTFRSWIARREPENPKDGSMRESYFRRQLDE